MPPSQRRTRYVPLLLCAVQVLLVANRGATINDITAAELSELLPRAADADRGVLGAAVAAGWLRVVCSGSDMPVIDLEQVGRWNACRVPRQCPSLDLHNTDIEQ